MHAAMTTSNTWNLNLPDKPVSRRISQGRMRFKGDDPVDLGELTGPGCINRIWITGRGFDSAEVILRIYFDDEAIPNVEAPLSAFFGMMHDQEFYQVNTPFIAVKPKNGYTSYFQMPFSKSARIEITAHPKAEVYFFYSIDWHEYPGQEMNETKRFCARWRRESPCQAFSEDFMILDADGPGQLIGFVYAVDMLESRHTARWSHAGGESIYIDGDGPNPAYIRGIGGEDTFGASFGGANYPQQTSLFEDMPYYVQKEGDMQKLVGYRFYVNDSINFDKSIHMRFGCRAHDISSTVYWYSENPVRPYYEIPPYDKRISGSVVKRGDYDLALPQKGQWWIAGPFPENFEKSLPSPTDFNSAKNYFDREWLKRDSMHGFIDFNHVYTHEPNNENSITLDGKAVAVCALEAAEDMKVKLGIAWDDQLILSVNGVEKIDLGEQVYLSIKTIEVSLLKGRNMIALQLSNKVGLTRGAWSFSFQAITANGEVLIPQAIT